MNRKVWSIIVLEENHYLCPSQLPLSMVGWVYSYTHTCLTGFTLNGVWVLITDEFYSCKSRLWVHCFPFVCFTSLTHSCARPTCNPPSSTFWNYTSPQPRTDGILLWHRPPGGPWQDGRKGGPSEVQTDCCSRVFLSLSEHCSSWFKSWKFASGCQPEYQDSRWEVCWGCAIGIKELFLQGY